MFLRPFVKTEERGLSFRHKFINKACRLRSGVLPHKFCLPYNWIIDLRQNGYSISYTGWDTLIITTNAASLMARVEMEPKIRMAHCESYQ